ncbi:MAG: NTP transferase domain-containing protein [Oscillospiraceae bacterium]
MIFGAILAGGVGSRMNIAEMPKQFLPLGEKPIIIHTIEKFLMCSKIDFLYVGVHPDWVLYTNDLLEKFLPQKKVTTVAS